MSTAAIDDLDAQIAKLQAQKAKELAKAAKRQQALDREEAKILVGTTPVKETKVQLQIDLPSAPKQPVFASSLPQPSAKASSSRHTVPDSPRLPSTAVSSASRLSSSLAALRTKSVAPPARGGFVPNRSSTFYQKPESGSSSSTKQRTAGTSSAATNDYRVRAEEPSGSQGHGKGKEKAADMGEVERDQDDLTIVNDLQLGPKEFGHDPEGGEEWAKVEPNSGIRLSKRLLPHSAVQDRLYGRYHLPPSQLYSMVRLSRDGATYDVPLEGDWVTIAVVAERGEVKVSGTRDVEENEDEDDDDDELGEEQADSGDDGVMRNTQSGSASGSNGLPKRKRDPWEKRKDDEKNKKKPKGNRRGPRKYINLKLCSLPPRDKPSSSGDAMLQLLLFQADHVVRKEEVNDEGEKVEHVVYKGGSGGAYEKWCTLNVGSVVAILNPRVLRPLRSGNSSPHPLTLPLALNPVSADSISLIGQAQDLGQCSAMQKDGNRCKNWVDNRRGQVCEFHLHAALERGRASRAALSGSAASYTLATNAGAFPGKGTYDPKNRKGLLPTHGRQAAPRGTDNGGGGATYVVGGGVVHAGGNPGRHFGNEHLSEKLGRHRLGKKARRLEERQAEEALQRLLETDMKGGGGSTGAKYLAKLSKGGGELGDTASGKIGGKKSKGTTEDEDTGPRKTPLALMVMRRMGFDSSSRGARELEDPAKRAESIAKLNSKDRVIKLGKPAGMGLTSVRGVPAAAPKPSSTPVATAGEADGEAGMVDLD